MLGTYDDEDTTEIESFVKFKKTPKTGKDQNPRRSDHQIRTARREKERAKQAVLEEVDSEE